VKARSGRTRKGQSVYNIAFVPVLCLLCGVRDSQRKDGMVRSKDKSRGSRLQ
jgi:hypothetical protein